MDLFERLLVFNDDLKGEHTCPKPVDLMMDLLKPQVGTNGIVLDLFGGSGSTMVAAASCRRRCYMMEIDPVYVQVIIDRMLAYKSSENELVKRISKGISVGIYGKFGEQYVANRKETFGKYFNSCYFAEISTRVRLKVADFIYRHDLEDSVLHISVDGVLSDKSVELTEKDIRAGWKLSGQNPALIISPGQLFTGGKHPKGLLLPDVLKLIEEHPQSGYYEKMIDRRVTLADAVAYGTLEDIGNMKPMHTSIDLFKAKHGRKFRELPRTGQQLLKKKYDSSPIKIMEDVD